MLRATRKIDLLERYRVPYRVEGLDGDVLEVSRAGGEGPYLLSVGSDRPIRHYLLDGASLFVALADEAAVNEAVARYGGDWVPEIPIVDLAGVQQGAVLAGPEGSVLLPFALDAPFDNLLEERYRSDRAHVRAIGTRSYYAVRPLLPRKVQVGLRRRFRQIQDRASFPSWPVETSLHRLEALVLGLLERVAGEPLPWISSWPEPYSWALVLTHDVERAVGYANVRTVRALESSADLRSAWYFVPGRDYTVEQSMLDELRADGCEIGLHGLRHDGLDLARATFPSRVGAMRSFAREWGVSGFRSPSTYRDRQLLQQLELLHDSSWSDVARYEPQPGGCCSWLPFFIGEGFVELPITLPQDYTMFELRQERTERPWVEKAEFLRDQEGMALILTHPDYLKGPERLGAYERFLAHAKQEQAVWHALPHEVAQWWVKRAASRLERNGDGWEVVGPAAGEARIRLSAPIQPPVSAAIAFS